MIFVDFQYQWTGVGQIGEHMEAVQKHVEEVYKQELEVVQNQLQRMVVKVVKVKHNDKENVIYNHAKVNTWISKHFPCQIFDQAGYHSTICAENVHYEGFFNYHVLSKCTVRP